jgi:DNA-binding NtrC family response regulator
MVITPEPEPVEAIASQPDGREPRLRIFIVGDTRFSAQQLPAQGAVSIGRDLACAIRVDEPSVALLHATLHLGKSTRLEALAEGTRVSGHALAVGEFAPVSPGDLLHLGNALLMLEGRPTPPPRRLLPHDYFELRVEEECNRAERHALQFTVLRVRCDRETPAEEIEETLADSVRLLDVVAAYGPGEYEVLLIDTPPEASIVVSDRVRRRLERRGASPSLGLASFPRDGRSADELADASRNALGGGSVAIPSSETAIALGPMRGLFEMLDRVAPSDISVLVFGETGVGKERMAEQVHKRSLRKDSPLVAINCAALAETLLESELFGHEKGAFTGAHASKQGLLETAQGGTIFLDEIGEMPMTVQVKLLRVLEERKVLRVGSLKPRPIDVRFVAATNRDLEAEVQRGTFREDLFYRLNGISLRVPPLRERIAEIAPLARGFLLEASARMKRKTPPELTREILKLLESYAWPGNVRELRNVIERAVLLCGSGPLLPSHLPEAKLGAPFAARRTTWSPRGAGLDPAAMILGRGPVSEPSLQSLSAPNPVSQQSLTNSRPLQPGGLRGEIDALERTRVAQALQQCAGNQSEAARILGMSRRTLVKRLAEWDFPRPRTRRTRT